MDEEWGVIPEWENRCLNTEILLQKGDNMTIGWVVYWKYDANSSLIGWSNKNPILDTHYEVAFPDGEITEVAPNITAELLYA